MDSEIRTSKPRLLPDSCSCDLEHYPLMQVDFDHSGTYQTEDLFDSLADEEMEAVEQLETQQSYNEPEIEEAPGCKCSKIGCLKLYCECFSRGLSCGKHCSCRGCQNCKGNQKMILSAQQMANFRKPGSFPGVGSFVPLKRCTCKKSHCEKKYCECHSAGIRCSSSCGCLDCHNREDPSESLLAFRVEIPVKG